MLKIGRYGVALGPVLWFQTRVPTQVWHFLCFWFIREARASDIDKKRRFPPNALLEQEGRKYRYWKASRPHQLSNSELVTRLIKGGTMKVYLTEQSATISLSEEEVQSLVEGKEVIGSPDTEFLSPFGKRIVIVTKDEGKPLCSKCQLVSIPGNSKEVGLEICNQLGIDPSRVLSINIFALHGTLVVKTLDGDVNCHLIPEKNKDNEVVFRIVKD